MNLGTINKPIKVDGSNYSKIFHGDLIYAGLSIGKTKLTFNKITSATLFIAALDNIKKETIRELNKTLCVSKLI